MIDAADRASTASSARSSWARWALPITWALMPFVAGTAFGDALATTSRSVQVVASVGLWLVWAAVLGAMLVPRTVTLTAVRIVVPAAIPALAWTFFLRTEITQTLGGEPPRLVTEAAPIEGGRALSLLLGLGLALLVSVLVLSAPVGDVFANGSSYGDERRMLLRPPTALLLGPVELAWAACVAGVVAGPLLLAASVWVPGVVVLAIGWPLAFVAARALHGLARRWVVFVPAGFVLHDLSVMTEALLLPRKMVRHLGPALADTRATDLTAGALGLALQADLTEPTPITPAGGRAARTGRGTPDAAIEISSFLFSPSRPGALLREARARRLAVD